MTLTRLWAFLAVALPVLAAMLASLSSVDLTYQLRAGREILGPGAIPTVDTWTFTAFGLPWVDQQWGAQVLLGRRLPARWLDRTGALRAVLVGRSSGCLLRRSACRRGLAAAAAALADAIAFVVAAPSPGACGRRRSA